MMFILHLVIILHGESGYKAATAVIITGEYRTFAACQAASSAIQRAAKRSAELVTCTSKG